MKKIPASELILNPDGSVYHLNLLPEDIADTIITVGDPGRVTMVSRYFDKIEIKKQKREFITHTGVLNGQQLTVMSTGMGMGNIDIFLNELDALVNIDLQTREIKSERKALRIIRIGTAGGLQQDVPLDSFVVSRYGIGLDGLLSFYDQTMIQKEEALKEAFVSQVFSEHAVLGQCAYVSEGAKVLVDVLSKLENACEGITITCGGFYGAQGRQLRLDLAIPDMMEKIAAFNWQGMQATNFEMETAAIYGLGALLGHHCCSVSAIVAQRHVQEFSHTPEKTVDELIQSVLHMLSS